MQYCFVVSSTSFDTLADRFCHVKVLSYGSVALLCLDISSITALFVVVVAVIRQIFGPFLALQRLQNAQSLRIPLAYCF
jgi:hypothetical protein